MSVSLSEFFCIDQVPGGLCDLKICLDYTSAECKSAAWYGDAVLSFLVAERLFLKNDGGLGHMSKKKAHYVSNSTMKAFLLECTDAVGRLRDADSMSDHSYGTVFESLLELCNRKAGDANTKSCVDRYCKWVDANLPQPVNSICITISDFENGSSITSGCNSAHLQSDQFKSTIVNMWQESVRDCVSRKEVVKVAPAPRAVEYNDEDFNVIRKAAAREKAPDPIATGHFNNEMIQARWRSNAKNWYSDSYFRCCGVRKGVVTCLRTLWIDASEKCHHPGELLIPGQKGAFQPGPFGQYGKGLTPNWTCCGQTSVAPGCVSQQDGNFDIPEQGPFSGTCRTSAAYQVKVEKWLKQYEDLVQKEGERTVGYGGVAQDKRAHSGKFSRADMFDFDGL